MHFLLQSNKGCKKNSNNFPICADNTSNSRKGVVVGVSEVEVAFVKIFNILRDMKKKKLQ